MARLYGGPCGDLRRTTDRLYRQIEELAEENKRLNNPVELALCEQDKIVLRPNVLYIFRPIEGCSDCEKIAKAYEND